MLHLAIGQIAMAQSTGPGVFPFDSFMQRVRIHHPLSMQARLQPSVGDALVLQAKGAFDPKLEGNFAEKYFDGKEYYNRFQGMLKIPTWFGPDIVTGFDRNMGQFLNPENNTPGSGLYYAGVVIPLGEGLFTDERRTALKQARLAREMSRYEQTLLLNDLYLDAGRTYWKWYLAWHTREVYRQAVLLAEERFQAVKLGAELGDRPDVDTLEAGIQVQNRQLGLQESERLLRNASAALSIFLWERGIIPLELDPLTQPEAFDGALSSAGVDSVLNRADTFEQLHPALRQYALKIDQLELERRWKAEQIKPDLDLKFNPLSEPVGGDPFANLSLNAYTWGASLSVPVFVRKERGALRLADYKIQEANYDLRAKQAELTYKLRQSLNDWEFTDAQFRLYTRTTRDYLGLLNAEREIFNSGESSLFLVNARETGYIQAQIKLIELLSKNRAASLEALHALGVLGEE